MLNTEIAKIELTGGYIGIMPIIEMAKIESTDGHIEILLIIEITKIKLTGGHIGFMRIIEITKIINRRPYWNYANYREYQNKINR